jgi:signal transduction histidine kinase
MSRAAEEIARAVAAQHTVPRVLIASAEVTRRVLGVDSAFVAVGGESGEYRMSITDGIRDPLFRQIVVRPRIGLGGQVLLRRAPFSVADYAHDPTISRDFVHVVCEVEKLQGMACVPVKGPDRIQALLYTATRTAGPPADRTMQTLELVAAYAELAMHQVAVHEQEVELAMLRERERLATKLHDTVAQLLFGIGVSAQYARRQHDPSAVAVALDEIEATAAAARKELRSTLHRLNQPPEGLAFEARLAGELRLFERGSGCRVRLTHRGERRDLPPRVEDLLVDAALEGLRNAVKYSRAAIAMLHLAYRDDSVALVLQSGPAALLIPPVDNRHATGTGLEVLRLRAARLRGVLELITDSTGGKVMRLELPARPPVGTWS